MPSNRHQTSLIYFVTSKLFSPSVSDEAVEGSNNHLIWLHPFINVANISISLQYV